jgi:hypothetical protein
MSVQIAQNSLQIICRALVSDCKLHTFRVSCLARLTHSLKSNIHFKIAIKKYDIILFLLLSLYISNKSVFSY